MIRRYFRGVEDDIQEDEKKVVVFNMKWREIIIFVLNSARTIKLGGCIKNQCNHPELTCKNCLWNTHQ